ncbi:MAG TPA: type 1 glutamine amidotransferase domain-containing protein [Puia sp.]|jgi:protease I|nr:type 1 glutamine amidotransferase domain-containing protein [Puia sp.]
MGKLNGKKVAILTENGFEEIELTSPMKALQEAGAIVKIVSPQKHKVRAWDHDHWSIDLLVDVQIDYANVDDYDALLIPGGVLNPDLMRTNSDCVDFAQQFLEELKPVAAICHGPQLLIETGMLRGKNLTSFPSIRSDLENAGAHWLDIEVVTDGGLTTSRSPKDLEAFNKRIIEEIAESNFASSYIL